MSEPTAPPRWPPTVPSAPVPSAPVRVMRPAGSTVVAVL